MNIKEILINLLLSSLKSDYRVINFDHTLYSKRKKHKICHVEKPLTVG